MELADKDAKALKGTESSLKKLSAPPRKQGGSPTLQRQSKPCYRCGRSNHNANDCRFKEATCHHCHKKGHIAPACLKKKREAGNTKHIAPEEGNYEGDSDDYKLHAVQSKASPPIMLTLEVEGRKLPMELDTKFANLPLHKSDISLQSYTKERIPVIGQLNVHVCYGEQKAALVLIVVSGRGPTLFGRNWLRYIHLDVDWKAVHTIELAKKMPKCVDLLSQHKELFSDGLGKMEPFRTTLRIRPDAHPRFFKPRPVPFAIKAAIEAELDELEASGAIEKVTHSDWAAPIVPVPKKNGKFRICGDYKVTINRELDVDQYPLPKPEDLFATLAGGKKFSKLDLSQAYQQLPLDEDSMQYVTINTHRGLYRYTRLPFGVASAPAIFQKLMDSVLQGIPNVICYLDDILVTGVNDDVHHRNLASVFERLQQHGFRLKQEKCAFMQESVEYLGHRIDAEGLHALPSKVDAIVNAPEPRNVQELRSFLGLLNYYGKFLPNLSSTVHPLNELLQQSKRWKWSTECSQAFQQAKQALSSANVLTHYDPFLPLTLAGDASAYGISLSHI